MIGNPEKTGYEPISASDGSVYFLAGPTACGKTSVAHRLAEDYGFEIISADASLVYRGMNIGTAKPTTEELARYKYHCVDIADPSEKFSVGKWLAFARAALIDCASRNVRVLVCGGTGLYMKALLEGLDESDHSDETRARLNAFLEREGVEGLRKEAEKLSPGILERMPDPWNARRLIRVLERLESGDNPLPSSETPSSSVRMPVLTFSSEILSARISQRVHEMFSAGLPEEVRLLMDSPGGWSESARGAIGYSETIEFLNGAIRAEDAVERISIRTRQFAKRQRTWYRHQISAVWIDGPSGVADVERAAADVVNAWREYGPEKIMHITIGKHVES